MSLEALKRKTSTYKGHVTRGLNSIDIALSSPSPDVENIKKSIVKSREQLDNYIKSAENYFDALTDKGEFTTLDDAEKQLSEATEEFEKSFLRIHDELLKKSPVAKSSTVPDPSSKNHLSLQKLTIEPFDGDILKWDTFWSLFESNIDKNPKLDSVQKFSYLVSLLKSQARVVIEGIPIQATSYKTAISVLKNRFAQPHEIIDSYINKILDISSPDNNYSSVQNFYDELLKYTRLLEEKGYKRETFDLTVVPLLRKKLPQSVKDRLIETKKSTSWELNDIFDCLSEYVLKLKVSCDNKFTNPIQDSEAAVFHVKSKSKPQNQYSSNPKCIFCSQNHSLWKCTQYNSPQERQDRAKSLRLCFNCLSPKHMIKECKSQNRCKSCGRKHNTLLCYSGVNTAVNAISHHSSQPVEPCVLPSQPAIVSQDPSTISTHTGQDQTQPVISAFNIATESKPLLHNSVAILKTAEVMVKNDVDGSSCTANLLLDDGSQLSFVSSDLADKLQLAAIGHEKVHLSVFGSQNNDIRILNVVKLSIICQNGEILPIIALVVPKITGPLKDHCNLNARSLHPNFKNLDLANCISNSGIIDILIGGDHYHKIVNSGNAVTTYEGGPLCVKTKLGYILTGVLKNSNSNAKVNFCSATMLNVLVDHTSLSNKLDDFFSLESVGIESPDINSKSKFDDESYVESIKYKDGRYVCDLPFKPLFENLHNNYSNTVNRTKSTVKSLVKKGYLSQYSKLIDDQLNMGIIEKVSDCDTNSGYFIPHHAVFKDSTTTPLRIVYDCSSKTCAKFSSLNDVLETGVKLHNCLISLLIKFRFGKIGLSSDISKAFHMISLSEKSKPFMKFLWLKENTDPLEFDFQIFQFCRVIFGAKPSPYMLNATIKKHLSLNPCDISSTILESIYVDNVINCVDTVEEAVKFFHESRSIMNTGNFNLAAWASNSSEVNNLAQSSSISDKNLDCVKVLGLRWNCGEDMLYFNPFKFDVPKIVTKRIVLSLSSKFFEPLGLLSPITVRVKIFLQDLWGHKDLTWDTPINTSLLETWVSVMNDIVKASHFSFKRFLFPKDSDQNLKLVAFADSSDRAYGGCVYIANETSCNLMYSRSRITPIKKLKNQSKDVLIDNKVLTTPKSELVAATLLVRMVEFIRSSLPDFNLPCTYWSDNQCVLNWINSNKNLKIWESRRVQEILKHSSPSMWHWVPSASNPSDLLTRGLSYENLFCNETNLNLWFHGPNFVLQSPTCWPKWSFTECDSIVSNVVTKNVIPDVGVHKIIALESFSTLKKLLHVTAYVFRFIKLTKPCSIGFTVKELTYCKNSWIKSVQQLAFAKELKVLKSGTSNQLTKQLNLYVENDIIRSAGRLHNAELDVSTKFPILLPKSSNFSSLVVLHEHRFVHHSGVNTTIVQVRLTFWIPCLRQLVKKLLHCCVTCKKVTGPHYPFPKTPPLPVSRIRECNVFSYVGLDFSGHISIVSSNLVDSQKAYVLLFTCAVSRSIHCELVDNLSVPTFFLAFRRFCSLRGFPQMLISDNASTFEKADSDLQKLLNSPNLVSCLSEYNCKWEFIPKRAAHFGGFWERLIGLTKTLLRKTLGNNKLSYVETSTLLYEISNSLNSRPLTYTDTTKPDEPLPLTPSMLIYGKNLNICPYPDIELDDLKDLDFDNRDFYVQRAKKRAFVHNQFIKKWTSEYVVALRERHSSKGSNFNYVKVGEIVLIHEDNVPRVKWPLGLITAVNVSSDGLIRSVHLKTKNGFTNRPVIKLYPLELSCHDVNNIPQPPQHNLSVKQKILRPTRAAKTKAESAISKYFKNDVH